MALLMLAQVSVAMMTYLAPQKLSAEATVMPELHIASHHGRPQLGRRDRPGLTAAGIPALRLTGASLLAVWA